MQVLEGRAGRLRSFLAIVCVCTAVVLGGLNAVSAKSVAAAGTDRGSRDSGLKSGTRRQFFPSAAFGPESAGRFL